MRPLYIGLFAAAVGGASASCLPDGNGIPAANRSFIRINGSATPLIFARDAWPMVVRIMAQVYVYILEEVYGIHTKLFVGGGEPGIYGMAGCNCKFCSTPVCGNGLPTAHVVVGLSASWVTGKQYVREHLPERYPDSLGEVGFESQAVYTIPEAARREAFSTFELNLDYYRSYNQSTDPSQFFSNISEVPNSNLRICNESLQTAGSQCKLHTSTDGKNDLEGFHLDAAGNCRARCHVDGYWWLAPACRQKPHHCIPAFTLFGGTGFMNVVASATVYGFPWAIGIPKTYKDYLTMPLDVRAVTFTLTPESAFNSIEPREIRLPRFSESVVNAASTSLRQTSFIYNGWAGEIEGVAGFQIREVLKRMQWSRFQAEEVSLRFLQIYRAMGYPARLAPAYKTVACEYVKKNKAVWQEWLPLASECPLGQGMRSGSGSFVFARDLAESCEWCSLGRFSSPRWDELGLTHVCLPCPAGQEQLTSAKASCSACLPGKHKAREGTELCQDCPPGNATELPGQSYCPACLPGRASTAPAQLSCNACPKGTSAPSLGAVACDFCGKGSFADEEGSKECRACGQVLAGSTSDRGSVSGGDCACPEDTYMLPGTGCQPCAKGLECPGGNGEPRQAKGYWVDITDAVKRQARDYTIYLCRSYQECPSGSLGSCAPGRQDTACNNCMNRHFPSGEGACLPCDSSSVLPVLTFALLAMMLVSLFIIFTKVDATRQHLSLVIAVVIAGQILTTIQALSAMKQIQIPWPEQLETLLDILGLFVFDLEVLRLPCLLDSDNPVSKFVLKLLAYPMFILLVLAIFFASRALGRPLEKMALINANGTFLLAVYISLTLAVALPFQCQGNPSGFNSMATQPGVRCFEDEMHITLSVLAFFGILLYPVGIAAYVAHATVKCKTMAHTVAGVQMARRFQFIFARYRPECYHFGLIFLLRNCLVALVPVLFVTTPVLQVNVIAFLLVLSLVVQVRYQPWRAELPNRTDTVMGTILVLLITGVAALLDNTSQGVSTVIGVAITSTVVLCLLGIFLVVVLSLQRYLFPQKLYGIFLCHHKAGAGNLCRLLKLLLAAKTSHTVFIDSDHLDDLDQLFETVRSNVENLVVVLTRNVLARPWCAGEIVTAHRNGINSLPLICDDFEPLDSSAIVQAWSEQELSLLGQYGIQPEMVHDAYEVLLAKPRLQLRRMVALPSKETTMGELVERCHLPLTSPMTVLRSLSQSVKKSSSRLSDDVTISSTGSGKEYDGQAKILVTGLVNDSEGLAACEVMQLELQRELEVGVTVIRNQHQLFEKLPTAQIFLVLWSRGVLTDPDFARVTLTVAESEPPPAFLTALVDPAFQFPSADWLEQVEREALAGLEPTQGPGLAAAYRSLLKILSRPFDPQRSQAAISEQVRELAGRAKRLLGKQPQPRSGWGQRLAQSAKVSPGDAPEAAGSPRLPPPKEGRDWL